MYELGVRRCLSELVENLKIVENSRLPDAEKQNRLQALERVRANVLAHADALDNLLFQRRPARRTSVPMTTPNAGASAPAN
jgi:hypothetical protein